MRVLRELVHLVPAGKRSWEVAGIGMLQQLLCFLPGSFGSVGDGSSTELSPALDILSLSSTSPALLTGDDQTM